MQLNDVPLSWLPVTVVDCQATGASPRSGRILELAWWVSGGDRVHAHLIALPEGERVPPRISRVTGIRQHDLAGAQPVERIWRRFLDALPCDYPMVPLVAHFARYERAFLDDLVREQGSPGAPALEYICTHEVARRLEPDLPRRGLRALAGYHGHHLGPHSRSAPHVQATRVIWREQVSRLKAQGVRTLGDLRTWLASTSTSRTGPLSFPLPREQRLALPDAPGVYRMMGRGGALLYVGKAGSLHRRVNSYFQKRRHATRETMELLTQVFSVEHTATATALEAALLEADLIKQRRPPYNSALKPRSREDDTWFCAADLSSISPVPDEVCTLGPLPGEQRARTLVLLGRLIGLGLTPADNQRRALGLPGLEDLSRDLLTDGAILFRDRHGLTVGRKCPGVLLLRLGAGLLRSREADAAAATGAEDGRPTEDRPWDAPRVALLLEDAVINAARLIRRGAWLADLAGSTVTWPMPDGDRARLLVLQGGDILGRRDLPASAPVPAPPAPGSRDMDLTTHDRLRVLTTELRRLLSADRPPTVVLGDGRRLEPAQLRRRLRWF